MYAITPRAHPTRAQLVVIHADLGRVEWDGVQDHIRRNIDHPLNVVRANKTLLDMVRHRFATKSPRPIVAERINPSMHVRPQAQSDPEVHPPRHDRARGVHACRQLRRTSRRGIRITRQAIRMGHQPRPKPRRPHGLGLERGSRPQHPRGIRHHPRGRPKALLGLPLAATSGCLASFASWAAAPTWPMVASCAPTSTPSISRSNKRQVGPCSLTRAWPTVHAAPRGHPSPHHHGGTHDPHTHRMRGRPTQSQSFDFGSVSLRRLPAARRPLAAARRPGRGPLPCRADAASPARACPSSARTPITRPPS